MKAIKGHTDHVVVVGAGLAGLSTALHLLGAGRRVTVVERDRVPGGRAGQLDVDGYRLDTGPTVLTMPELLDEAFSAVGDSLAARLDLVPLHPAYVARFPDGSSIDVHSDADAMEAEVLRVAGPGEAAGYRRLRQWLTGLYVAERDRFIGANFDSPLDLVGPSLAGWPAWVRSGAWARRSAASSRTAGCGESSRSSRCTPACRRSGRSRRTR
ncbi:hypothetical protein GCM10018954_077810 [Kutzneria kofuensis]